MAKKAKCQHTQMGFEIERPQAFEDSNIMTIKLRAYCRDCDEPMRCLGIEEGFSMMRPSTNLDGTDITLPLVIGFEDAELPGRRLAS